MPNSSEVSHLRGATIDLSQRADDQYAVQQLWLQGGMDYRKIAKQLKLKPAYAQELVNDVRGMLLNDDETRLRAKEVVMEFDLTTADVKQKLYEAVEEADAAGDLKSKIAALKHIADNEAKKVDTLQKSGLLTDISLGDQLIEQEDKLQKLIELLRRVASRSPELKSEILRELSIISGKAQSADTVIVNE